MNNTKDQIFRCIEDNLEDWVSYLVLSDYLQDNQGDPKLIHALRWMGRRQKRPFKAPESDYYWLGTEGRVWAGVSFSEKLNKDQKCRLSDHIALPTTVKKFANLNKAFGWLADRLEGLRRTYEAE